MQDTKLPQQKYLSQANKIWDKLFGLRNPPLCDDPINCCCHALMGKKTIIIQDHKLIGLAMEIESLSETQLSTYKQELIEWAEGKKYTEDQGIDAEMASYNGALDDLINHIKGATDTDVGTRISNGVV